MNQISNSQEKEKTKGIVFGFSAYALWGILPIYWKYLKQIPAMEILAHRILWSFVFIIFLIFINKKTTELKVILKDRKKIAIVFICALLITINWGLYIYAVNANHIIEASMGYFINPLLVTFLGMIVFKEKLNLLQFIALGLATCGVLIQTIEYGKFPWISVSLALSFGLYGLFKKLLKVESIVSIALETSIIMPFALAYILFLQFTGVGAIGKIDLPHTVLILMAGFVTATPLIWFSKAANRIKLSTLGFLQYISPTLSLIIGVYLYKESFDKSHLVSFAFIWAALIIYTLSHSQYFNKKSKGAIL